MYARIDVPGDLEAGPRAAMTELQTAVRLANEAHEAATGDSAAQSAADKVLQQAISDVESRICGNDYETCAALRAALTSVRDRVRTRLINAGESSQPAGEPKTSLSQLISDLPDEAAERLTRALIEHCNEFKLDKTLRNLFPKEDMSSAAVRWRNYLDTPPRHTIIYLGGSNILNFKVATIPAGLEPTEVLKVEYRFGYARRMDAVVRESVPGLLTPTAAVRMVMASKPSAPPRMEIAHKPSAPVDLDMARKKKEVNPLTGRNLMVTTFCAHGGADAYTNRLRKAATAPGSSAAVFAQQIHDIATQMCNALQKIEANNIYFPDAKLSNWVVDEPHTLQIADTKSFLRSPPDRRDFTHPDNCGKTKPLGTRGYAYNEVFGNMVTPTQIHAAIFGRNLYEILTGNIAGDAKPPDCIEPVFSGPAGDVYRTLIKDLMQNPANTRITLAEAAQRLRMIEIMLDPAYPALEAKIRDIGLLTEQDLSPLLLSSVRAVCTARGFTKNAALLALNDVTTRALASARSAEESSKTIINQQKCAFYGRTLFPAPLLHADRATCMGSPANLDQLAEGWAAYARHLEVTQAALPQLKSIQGLANHCRSQRFGGNRDVTMTTYLRDTIEHATEGSDLVSRLANANEVLNELTVTLDGLRGAGVNEIHLVLQSLRELSSDEAKEKAVAIEDAAIAVPISQRSNLMAHLNEPKVRALLDALAQNHAVHGLNAVAADPMSIEEYQRVMNAISPPNPDAPDPENKNSMFCHRLNPR